MQHLMFFTGMGAKQSPSLYSSLYPYLPAGRGSPRIGRPWMGNPLFTGGIQLDSILTLHALSVLRRPRS